jgi:hypothetical protein
MNYEEEYYYNVEEIQEENIQVSEQDLPAIVRNWEKVAISYSRYNNIPAIISYYNLLGDLVKNMVEIPFGPTTNDTRIHFCWIQTARTGKTTLIMYVLTPVAKSIYEDLHDDEYVDSDVVNFADYNTASLVGSHTENKNFSENAEEIYGREMQEIDENIIYTVDERTEAIRSAREKRDANSSRWNVHLGPIHGEGIWFADEFEGSGVFKDKNHKENMNIVFQTLMNNFHNGSNVYEKILTGKPVIPLDCRYSLMACTFPPDQLLKTVAEKGILQRFLPFIWDVPDDTKTEMRKDVIKGFGTISKTKGPPLHLKKGILEIYKLTKARFESVGKDKLKTISYNPDAMEALDSAHNVLLEYISNVNPRIRDIIRLFEMNLVEYIGKLAVLNCISMSKGITNPDERFIVSVANVRQGAYVVRKCYMALVQWLENAMKGERKTIAAKSSLKEFQHAYQVALDRAKPQEQLEGGYVWKKLILDDAGKILEQSPAWIYNKYNTLSEMFESKKKGRQAYIRPKKQEE